MTHVPDPDISDDKVTAEGVPTDDVLPEGHPTDPDATDPGSEGNDASEEQR